MLGYSSIICTIADYRIHESTIQDVTASTRQTLTSDPGVENVKSCFTVR